MNVGKINRTNVPDRPVFRFIAGSLHLRIELNIMKHILGITVLTMTVLAAHSQFYYKDLVTVQQTNSLWNTLKSSKIRTVTVQSFEANNQPSEGFSVKQDISGDRIVTITQSPANGTSEMTATYNAAGRLVQTVDTSADYYSTTQYDYDGSGRITTITNNSRSGEFTSVEVHSWSYDAAGRPVRMLRIRNNTDTTYVNFVLDEKGNPVEEHAVRRKLEEPVIYYYYDDKNQLTDIVRYNQKAGRLLPTHVFSYTPQGRIAGMLLVPEGSNEYQRWFYDYDERGLKVRERVFNKRQELMGKVEFTYGM